MSDNIYYSYDDHFKEMIRTETTADGIILRTSIRLIENIVLFENMHLGDINDRYDLDESQYYIFNDLMINIAKKLTDEQKIIFCNDIFNNKFYVKNYLPHQMSIGEALFLKEKSVIAFILNLFFLFSYMILPTQQIDNQIYLFPNHSKQLYQIYQIDNSMLWYYMKRFLRLILAIPGMIISPLIYIIIRISWNTF